LGQNRNEAVSFSPTVLPLFVFFLTNIEPLGQTQHQKVDSGDISHNIERRLTADQSGSD
jgi:hypothetical protein